MNQVNSTKNKILLMVTCYLCYFFTASVVLITGALMVPISQYFNVKIQSIGFAFTFVNVSMWFAIFIIGMLMARYSLKKLLIVTITIGILASLLACLSPSMTTFKILLTAVGFTGGLFMAIASYMVVHMSKDHKIRAMNVIFTDFFFSFGGVVVPIFGAYLVTINMDWYSIYAILQVTAIVILVLVILSDYSQFDTTPGESKSSSLSLKSWNKSLYFIAFAAFFFLLGQLILVGYGPAYFEKVLGWSQMSSNQPLQYFWTAQCLGLFLSPLITKKVSLRKILPIFMIISTAALAYIIYTPDVNSVLVAAVVFGIFNCYIYAGLLAYGTFQMKTPPPTLITTILLFGTTGTALSTTLGATILSISGSLSVVVHSVVLFYAVSLVLIILAVFTSKEKEFTLDK